MYLLIVAVILTILKWQNINPVAEWSWWVILGFYAATAVWWTVADSTGYTKRKAIERENKVKNDRTERHRDALRTKHKK